MRRLLGVLREDAGRATPAELAPQPGLGQLNDLLDEARDASGAGTRLILRGRAAHRWTRASSWPPTGSSRRR